jgi:rubrerythrin
MLPQVPEGGRQPGDQDLAGDPVLFRRIDRQERGEHRAAYPEFAAIADQGRFPAIIAEFRATAEVETAHERRYRILARQVEAGVVFKKDREVTWKCRNCGYTVKALEAPKRCPACGHPQSGYEVQEVLE